MILYRGLGSGVNILIVGSGSIVVTHAAPLPSSGRRIVPSAPPPHKRHPRQLLRTFVPPRVRYLVEHDQHVDCRIVTPAKHPVCLPKPTANVLEGHFRCPRRLSPPSLVERDNSPAYGHMLSVWLVCCCMKMEDRAGSCTTPSSEFLRDAVPAHSTVGAMQFAAPEGSPIPIRGRRTSAPSKITVEFDSDICWPDLPLVDAVHMHHHLSARVLHISSDSSILHPLTAPLTLFFDVFDHLPHLPAAQWLIVACPGPSSAIVLSAVSRWGQLQLSHIGGR